MSKQLRELQARKSALVKEARALTDLAASESRDLGDDEVLAFDALTSQMNATSAAIDRETTLISEEVTMQPTKADAFVSVTDNRENDPKRGFAHIGEYLQSVRRAESSGRSIDERLLIGSRNAAAPSSYGSDNSGADGGFLVPPTFSQEIFLHSLGEDALLPLTDNVTTDSNSMAFPRDETTPWGTTGIRAYWQAEASTATVTKPVLGLNTLRMKKLMALVPVTDEPTDIIVVKGRTMRITKMTRTAAGVFECEAVADDSNFYAPTVVVTETPTSGQVVATLGETTLLLA